MDIKLTRRAIARELATLGVSPGMELEVHSSLSSFGHVEGGAPAVVAALKDCVGAEGSIFMPALRISRDMPLTSEDRRMGILRKIKILPPDCERSAMGAIADAFRATPGTQTGEGVFRISGWGRNARQAVSGGLDYVIHNGGMALLLGVDIYSLTAMHYVEDILPPRIREIFAPGEAVNALYPPGEWLVETGAPPVQAWYTIQDMAFERGLVRERKIGECRALLFPILDVISLYRSELERNPCKLYGLE